MGEGQCFPAGWELPGAVGLKHVSSRCWYSSAPLTQDRPRPAAFASFVVTQMLKPALHNIYLTQCLVAQVFIHKSAVQSPELPGVACGNCEALLCNWPKSCWAFSVLLPCSALLRWWREHCPPSLCCGIRVRPNHPNCSEVFVTQ